MFLTLKYESGAGLLPYTPLQACLWGLPVLKPSINSEPMAGLAFALLISLHFSGSSALRQGVSWPSEGWSHPNATYMSSWANRSIVAIKSVGATHLRITATAYVSWINSPIVFTRDASVSPLRTASYNELKAGFATARAQGLSVMLAPILDLDWDNSSNIRLWWQDGSSSRSEIGTGFSPDEWTSFFSSYTAWLVPLAQLASEEGVTEFSIGDELSTVFLQVGCAPSQLWVDELIVQSHFRVSCPLYYRQRIFSATDGCHACSYCKHPRCICGHHHS